MLYGCRAVGVGSDEHDALTLRTQEAANLAGGGGLTGALQADEHDDSRFRTAEVEAVGRAEGGDQLFVDDFDDLLARVQGARTLMADGALTHTANELSSHTIVDICFEQSHAHFSHGNVNIRLGQFPVAAELFKYLIQAFGQVLKHGLRF